jgi:hypothetical protein
MKFGLILLLSIAAAAQSPAPLLPASSTNAPTAKTPPSSATDPQDANARKARELVHQAIQALGGQAYLSVKDMRQEGRTYSFYRGEANSQGILFWRFWKWPDKDRIELTKQRDVIYIVNGDQGYEITFRGTRPDEAKNVTESLRQREYSLDRVLRFWLTEPDVALFYEGQSVADNRQVDKITIMNSKNQGVSLYLDQQSHLPIKKSFSWRDTDRYRNEDSEIYGDYHMVQGINTPFQVVREHNGEMTRQRFLSSVAYNTGIADSVFEAKVTYDPEAKKPQP